MTAGTHILAGIVLASYLKLPVIPAALGSILPDIDLKKGLPFPPKRTLLNAHRGITHHPAIAVLLFLLSLSVKDLLNREAGILLLSFTAGYASHLLLDILTPLGIPYKTGYYPRLTLKLFKTGKIGELFVILLLLSALIYQAKTGALDYTSFKLWK